MPDLVPKEAANYRTADEGAQSCSNCANFISPSTCKLVEPPVAAAGICDLWVPLQNEQQVVDQLFGPAEPPA